MLTPQEKWQKEKSGTVLGKYRKEFVDEFKEACKKLGITQSEVIRQAMIETIKKAEEQ